MKQEIKDIQTQFYQVIKRKLSINDFELWLYNTPEIGNYLSEEFYTDLISLNYNDKYILNNLEKKLKPMIPFECFEKIRLTNLLSNIINENTDLTDVFAELYHNYCQGYTFLRYLGLAYILNGIEDGLTEDIWEKIKEDVTNEASRILGFIECGQLKITSEFEYEDLRENKDKIEIQDLESMFNKAKRRKSLFS